MKLRCLFLLLPMLVLAGCATHDPKAPLNGYFYTPQDSDAKLIIYRTTGFAGSLIPVTLSINGQSFAKLEREDYVELSIPEGDHTLSVVGTMNPDEMQITFLPKDKKYLLVKPNNAQFGAIFMPIAGTQMKLFIIKEIDRIEFEKYQASGNEVSPAYVVPTN